MQIIQWKELSSQQKIEQLNRPVGEKAEELSRRVAQAMNRVKEEGLEALIQMTQEFDGVQIKDFRVPEAEFSQALKDSDPELISAIEVAIANISAFHEKQRPQAMALETMPGVSCQRQYRPIQRVGLYIPAGSAPLFSTVLMLAIPAKLAGAQKIVLCTPPQKNGKAHPSILAACALCGVGEVYTLGGVQAIASMAYGAGPVPKVDKIFGPGNSYVTEAKTQASQMVPGLSIDMPAGPSEVLVIADEKASDEFVAWDLLSQAEHGPDSQAILVTTSESLCKNVQNRITEILKTTSRSVQLSASVEHMRLVVVDKLEEAVDISNEYAPEHLILNTENAEELVAQVINAGSVFVGPWTPESVGDYASGTNHVLPTSAYARSIGGLTLESFMKSMTVQSLSKEGVRSLSKSVEAMARAEGLNAHLEAMASRRRKVETM